jgi:hypothetical protein
MENSMIENTKGSFYGPDEVVDIKEVDNSMHEITLSGGKKVVLSTKMLAEVVKEQPQDLTELRNARCFPVVSDILKVLLNWNIKLSEIDFVNQRVIMSLEETHKKANAAIWGKELDEQTLQDVQNILQPKQ